MIATASVNAKLPTPNKAKASSVTCEFVMPGCQHEKIFHEEYLRTNRTSHTKIMRCFPHCCPGHRPRSYCGAPLHVKIKSQSPETDDQLVVYGRFRPVHLPALRVGDRVQASEIQASLQRVDPSNGEWVESKVSRHETEPLLFVIAPHDHWFYPWSGAATVAMRATHHVFEALVFCRVSDTELEVVANTSSPRFRLKSYRRNSAKPSNDKDDDGASPRGSPKRKAATRAPSPTESPSQRPPLGSRDSFEASMSHFAQAYQQSQMRGGGRAGTVSSPQTEAHAAAFSPATAMNTLMTWLQDLPANSAGSRLLLSWQRIVLEACEAHKAAAHDASSGRAGLVPILSALDIMEAPASAPVRSSAPPSAASSPLDTIDAAARVLLNEWFDLDSVRSSSSAVERAVLSRFPLSRGGLAAAHGDWLADVGRRAQRYVHQHTTTSWSQVIAAATRSRSQNSSLNFASEFSSRAFVARTRERLQHQYRWSTSTESIHKRQRTASSEQAVVPEGLRHAAPVWTNRMEDVAIEMNGMNQHGMSVLTVLQFWKHLSCLRLDFTTALPSSSVAGQLSVASVFNSQVRDGSFTKLTLDGQYRWFNCMPSGEPTIGTTLMGYVVGDYVGRSTSAGTVHVTTYLWPTTSETSTAFAWHWTLDAASLSSDSSSSVVSVVVESASVGRTPHAMETMSMAEKLRYVGRWQHVCELRLVYNTQ